MYTRHYDLTPDGMRQAFAECVGPYDNITEDDVYQLAYMVGTALIRRNRSLGVASDEAGGSMLASCSVYAPGGRIKSAAISVKFPNVVGVPTAICFSEDGRVRFGSGMGCDAGMACMMPVFKAFDEWARELHEFRVKRALGVPDGAALRCVEGKGCGDA